MSKIKKTRVNQDTDTVLMVGAVLVTGVIMIVLSALYSSSFIAVVGVSVAFWSVLFSVLLQPNIPFLHC